MKKFIINNNDSGQRIDKFIKKALPELPKSMMYRLIRKKDIKINGKRCEISSRLVSGDIVTVYVKDEVSTEKKHNLDFLNSTSNIEIVYEDKNIIIVNKPVGLDSHSNGSPMTDTMIDRIKKYLYDKGEYSPENESSFSPALCSRLDRNTCGLITAAKTAIALRYINEAIRSGKVHKVYHCITAAPLPKSEDVITAYHQKDETRNTVKIIDSPSEGFKQIKTGYRVLCSKPPLSLVEVTLFTGRTHQIRAHLAHINAPVLGDGKYGIIAINKRYGMFRQALCAYTIKFELSDDSELCYLNSLVINAPTPDFEKKFFS
ncbi:RluA family pseudouridine synthase [Ruminococcus sp.]|uniref:RluA family pseudouridine synthase n=1 Tax=Ruminococcus sp. TaxID=41978 RepID=UPI0025EB0525|nr:RluA family pseudouridine synthase [Ruminococcus sp.]